MKGQEATVAYELIDNAGSDQAIVGKSDMKCF